jgi:hypothetical protein
LISPTIVRARLESSGWRGWPTTAKGDQPSVIRRGLARATAAVSLGAASMTRRLDECVADDLGRTLAVAD